MSNNEHRRKPSGNIVKMTRLECYKIQYMERCTVVCTWTKKKDENQLVFVLFVEQGTGIEPASEAWEATIITNIRTLHRLLG